MKNQLTEADVRKIAMEVVNQMRTQAQYGISKIPDHHHNGTDSTKINSSELAEIPIFSGNGVPSFRAAKGSLYSNLGGSAVNNRLYINTNNSTGWTNVTTAA